MREVPPAEPAAILEFEPSTSLTRSDWRYTARPQWSSAGESMWMRLAKFSLCNRMGVSELADLLSLRDPSSDSVGGAVDLRRIGCWDQNALAAILEISLDDVHAGFCCVAPRHLLTRSSTELRYCKPCLTMGFHAAWFQWMHIERCPLHNVPLRAGCFHCSSPIPYELGAGLALSPLCCAACGHGWVPSLTRPGGRCAPLGRTAGITMQHWSEYVQKIVTLEHHLGRDRSTGQFVATRLPARATAAVRPHVLTMMNRLFDSPPPMHASGTPRRMDAKRRPPSPLFTDSATTRYRDIGFDRDQWPHFAGDFIRYERMVLAARDQLFEPHGRDFAGWKLRRLLLDGLLAPTSAIPRDAAAAAGWAVSWLGPSQALAPPTGFAAPAAGLTGWLANLPLRTPRTSVKAWRDQVAQWLADDLTLSACMWTDVAEFMSTRGHYVLYGEAVHLRSLATWHGAAKN